MSAMNYSSAPAIKTNKENSVVFVVFIWASKLPPSLYLLQPFLNSHYLISKFRPDG